jgi:hypothetical protein
MARHNAVKAGAPARLKTSRHVQTRNVRAAPRLWREQVINQGNNILDSVERSCSHLASGSGLAPTSIVAALGDALGPVVQLICPPFEGILPSVGFKLESRSHSRINATTALFGPDTYTPYPCSRDGTRPARSSSTSNCIVLKTCSISVAKRVPSMSPPYDATWIVILLRAATACKSQVFGCFTLRGAASASILAARSFARDASVLAVFSALSLSISTFACNASSPDRHTTKIINPMWCADPLRPFLLACFHSPLGPYRYVQWSALQRKPYSSSATPTITPKVTTQSAAVQIVNDRPPSRWTFAQQRLAAAIAVFSFLVLLPIGAILCLSVVWFLRQPKKKPF